MLYPLPHTQTYTHAHPSTRAHTDAPHTHTSLTHAQKVTVFFTIFLSLDAGDEWFRGYAGDTKRPTYLTTTNSCSYKRKHIRRGQVSLSVSLLALSLSLSLSLCLSLSLGSLSLLLSVSFFWLTSFLLSCAERNALLLV